ncbi:MAG: DUF59 domain-containing protein, partial [Alistipes sp.]|nr:DUF59 domain-containing protein [Alistipes sp.]
MESQIKSLLSAVIHPETGQDIVTSGVLEQVAASAAAITITLRFPKSRDPFALKIKNRVEELVSAHFPEAKLLVMVKEG